jgi:CRP-like cAMP-binding protein
VSADDDLFKRFGKTFPAGAVLFSEGEVGREMYVIQGGRVQLTRMVRGREIHLATLPPGEFFGEMAIVNNRPRSAKAVVVEESQLLVIDGRTFEAMVRGNAEIALRFIKKMAARLEQANQQVETLLVADLNHRVAHHLRQLASTVGDPDGPGVRIDIALEDIAHAVNGAVVDVETALERLERAGLVARELGSLVIAELGKLDDFLEFLQLKNLYGAS